MEMMVSEEVAILRGNLSRHRLRLTWQELPERKLDDGQSVFILLSSRQFLPSVITLIVFGVVPALLLGAILSWLINRFSMTQ